MIGGLIRNRFRVDQVVQASATTTVARATDTARGVPVAIKLIAAEDRRAARVEREALLLQRLIHPALPRYVDHGRDGGRLFLVTEWIEGVDLATRLRAGPLALDEALALGERVADALGTAHALGIVHRDVKPANVMLPAGLVGRAVLVDFDVLAVVDGATLAEAGDRVGTVGYMAPEQLRDGAVGAAADVFGLGCLLHECIGGAPAFAGDDVVDVIRKLELAPPAPLDAPAPVVELIARLLAKDPAGRPVDGRHAARAIAWLRRGDRADFLDVARDDAALPAWTEPASTTLLPFAGRDRELAEILDVLADGIEARRPRAVVVVGPPGQGKSRLGSEIVRTVAAAHDLAIWSAAGQANRVGTPLAVLAPLVRQALQAGVIVVPAARAIVADLAQLDDGDGGEAVRGDPQLLADQRAHGWEELLATAAEQRPVLLVIEDLHWADATSVRLLDRAIAALPDLPVLVVALARPGFELRFPRLFDGASPRMIQLGPLSRRAVTGIAAAVLGDRATAELVDPLFRHAEGNPLFFEELLRATSAGVADVPPTVLAALGARFAQLPAGARRVLGAAAILGEPFARDGVSAMVAGVVDRADVDAWLLELRHRDICRAAGELEGFRHALLQEAALAGLPADEIRDGHRLAAAWMRTTDADPARLAEHLERAGDAGPASEAFVAAAARALAAADLDGALALAARGLALDPAPAIRAELQVVEAEGWLWQGKPAPALTAARAALAVLATGATAWWTAVALAADAAAGLSDVAALDSLVATVDLAVDAGDLVASDAQVRALSRLAVQLILASLPAGERVLERVETIAQRRALAPTLEAQVINARADVHLVAGDLGTFLELEQRAAALFDRAGDRRNACLFLGYVGYAAYRIGANDLAESTLRDVLDRARRLGLHDVIAKRSPSLAIVLARRGQLDEARAIMVDSVERFRAVDNRMLVVSYSTYLVRIELAAGDLASAAAHAAAAEAALDGARTISIIPQLRSAQAELLLARGEADQALAACEDGLAVRHQLGALEVGEIELLVTHAEALDAAGRHDDARARIAEVRGLLDARGARISNPELRGCFLAGVPHHARAMAHARRWLERG